MADTVYKNCCPKSISHGYFWVEVKLKPLFGGSLNFLNHLYSSFPVYPSFFFILGVRKFCPFDKGILFN